jgi:DNA-binding LytR/AlgR family response regulator
MSKKLHIAIVDDEKIWQEKVYGCLKKHFAHAEIDIFNRGKDLLEIQKDYQMVFMDIGLGEENGLEISDWYNQFHKGHILIILTAYTEFSRSGYHVNAFRYIDKLKFDEEIKEALASAKLAMSDHEMVELSNEQGDSYTISCSDIIYCEAQNHQILIKMIDRELEYKSTIRDLLDILERHGFYQVHRSYIVNLKHIYKFNTTEVIMSNGQLVYMSRRRYGDFKSTYMRWRFERGNA